MNMCVCRAGLVAGGGGDFPLWNAGGEIHPSTGNLATAVVRQRLTLPCLYNVDVYIY